MDWARMFLDAEYTLSTGITLRWHRDQFSAWDGSKYRHVPDTELTGVLLQWLDERGAVATPRLASDVVKCLASEIRVPVDVEPPALLGARGASYPDWLALGNGVIDLGEVAHGTMPTLKPSTPRHFSTIALPYDYDPTAECPVWFETLNGIFDGDVERVDLLAEWFGYCLTHDTRHHKIMLIEGAPRTGKSTLLRTMQSVIGPENCVSPRLTALSELFGLWNLVGKKAAICPDAHLGHGDKALATLELLKLISGEDSVEVHRKHLPSITMRLRIRFALACNELPKFGDYASALEARILVLPCRTSFVGREDKMLENKLLAERPGILRWSLEGLARLRERGGFTQPSVSTSVQRDFARLVNPVRAFLDDACDVRPDAECSRDKLWAAWKDWCEANGHRHGSRDVFGSRLRTLVRGLATRQPRMPDGTRPRFYQGITLK
jgi:putative DNA primase/helicase